MDNAKHKALTILIKAGKQLVLPLISIVLVFIVSSVILLFSEIGRAHV